MSQAIRGVHYLRAVAALMVVAYHAAPLAAKNIDLLVGARGVDIFFVISGFVMAYSLRVDQTRPSAPSPGEAWASFLLKRFIRVVPMYWLALSLALVQAWHHAGSVQGAWMDYLFIPHWSVQEPGNIFPLFVPGWTINAEMYFYALFSLVVFQPRWRMGVIALLLGLLLSGTLVNFQNAAAHFYTGSVFLGFVLGMGLEELHERLRARRLQPPAALGWLMLAMGLLGLQLCRQMEGTGLLPACAALAVAGSIYASQSLSSKWWSALGDASYSIYLAHTFTFTITKRIQAAMGLLLEGDGLVPTLLRIVLYLGVAALCGWLLHTWVEKPLTRWLRQRLLKRPA